MEIHLNIWVKTIYNNVESCVINNGWLSTPFKIQRGLRQGCPLSALLFLLVVEILAIQIRKYPNEGLKVKVNGKNIYINITQLADDTTHFLKSEDSVLKEFKIVDNFEKNSGLKLNKGKTEGLWIGRGRKRNDALAGINWTKSCVKALGIFFGYNKTEIERLNWETKIESVKSSLKWMNCRDLSLQGRILIIKTIALSKVICTLNWVTNELNKEFFSFLWRNKRDKIARKVSISDVEQGGLSMIDFKTLIYP